jgi:hypothetical protein
MRPSEQWRREHPREAGEPRIIENKLCFVNERGRVESTLDVAVSHPDIPIPARSVKFEGHLLFAAPALIGPAILGAIIWLKYRRRELGRLSAIFTLKPIIATPLWAAIMAIVSPPEAETFWGRGPPPLAYFLTALPGVGLTLVIVAVFWSLFVRSKSGAAFLLVVLDCFRWGITIIAPVILALPVGGSPLGLALCLLFTAERFPTLYGIVALVVAVRDKKRSHSPNTHDAVIRR